MKFSREAIDFKGEVNASPLLFSVVKYIFGVKRKFKYLKLSEPPPFGEIEGGR